jgi:hypothetical protein
VGVICCVFVDGVRTPICSDRGSAVDKDHPTATRALPVSKQRLRGCEIPKMTHRSSDCHVALLFNGQALLCRRIASRAHAERLVGLHSRTTIDLQLPRRVPPSSLCPCLLVLDPRSTESGASSASEAATSAKGTSAKRTASVRTTTPPTSASPHESRSNDGRDKD